MSNPSNIYVTIMAGGVGSRFWPASRSARPKQFLDMLGLGKSFLRMTFERFLRLTSADHIYVITNQAYRKLVQEHLPELSDAQIICEPSRNNTAPCVAYASLKLHHLNPEANMIVAPADHLILDEPGFVAALKQALQFSEQNQALLTLGMEPTSPHTGYGYIQYDLDSTQDGIYKVEQFVEKPPVEKAKAYLAEGNYLWNAGIFIWQTKDILRAFQDLAPEIYEELHAGWEYYNSPKEQAFIDKAYPKTTKISVDYAIMEKADNVYTLPASFGWSDLGTWESIYQLQQKDEHENVCSNDAQILLETNSCFIKTPADKLVVVKGLEDFIIVDDDNVLLIYPKSEEQQIKQITNRLKEQNQDRYL